MKWPDRAHLDRDAEVYARALALVLRIGQPLVMVYHAAIVLLVAMAIALLAFIAWQASDRAVPVRLRAVALLTPTVQPGGRIRVRYALRRLRICGVDLAATIFDGADEAHPLVTVHRDVSGPLGADGFTRSFAVPADARPGRARLREAWSYSCPGNYAQVLSPVALPLPDLAFTISPH